MKTEKKILKTYKISESIYNAIIKDLHARIEVVDDISKYFYGYSGLDKHKKHIVLGTTKSDSTYLVMLERVLAEYIPIYSTEWLQCRVLVNDNQDDTEDYSSDITPRACWNSLVKVIKKKYTNIEDQLLKYQAEYDDDLKQVHIVYDNKVNNLIYKFDNCYKFDINGAHCDALCEIFPLCKQAFIGMYNKRHNKGGEKYKKIFNYSVGMLVPKGFRNTYNWIVQRTTKILTAAMKQCDGQILYANTDGFLVKDPKNIISYSKCLGDFKLEFSGDAYFYRSHNRGSNYYLIQTGDEKKGTCRKAARDLIDLRDYKVVHYDIKTYSKTGANGKPIKYQEVENKTQENLSWQKVD